MAETVVVNSSPLIALARMDALFLLEQLPYDLVIPFEVRNELFAGTNDVLASGIPDALDIRKLSGPRSPKLFDVLDSGEAAVIQLAIEINAVKVCIDEVKGRRVAIRNGLIPIGSLGLLGRAKSLGLVSEIRPFVLKAVDGGIRYDDDLISNFLKRMGE